MCCSQPHWLNVLLNLIHFKSAKTYSLNATFRSINSTFRYIGLNVFLLLILKVEDPRGLINLVIRFASRRSRPQCISPQAPHSVWSFWNFRCPSILSIGIYGLNVLFLPLYEEGPWGLINRLIIFASRRSQLQCISPMQSPHSVWSFWIFRCLAS